MECTTTETAKQGGKVEYTLSSQSVVSQRVREPKCTLPCVSLLSRHRITDTATRRCYMYIQYSPV